MICAILGIDIVSPNQGQTWRSIDARRRIAYADNKINTYLMPTIRLVV